MKRLLFVLLLFVGKGAWAWTMVQSHLNVAAVASSASSTTFTTNDTAGNTIIVAMAYTHYSTFSNSVTDTEGNTYTTFVSTTPDATTLLVVGYATNIVGGTKNQVIFHFQPGSDGFLAYSEAVELSHTSSIAFDQFLSSSSNAGTTATSAALTPANASEFIYAVGGLNPGNGSFSGTPSGGFTDINAVGGILWDGYQISASVTPFTASVPMTVSQQWNMGIIAFKVAGGGTTAPPGPGYLYIGR